MRIFPDEQKEKIINYINDIGEDTIKRDLLLDNIGIAISKCKKTSQDIDDLEEIVGYIGRR